MNHIAFVLKILPLVLIMIQPNSAYSATNFKKATFAGGCFWCMEHPFEELDGVTQVISGYTGGHKDNPTYEEVSSGTTGHLETVQITYDPSKVTYPKLLDIFWRNIDPTDPDGQFVDRGKQYTTAIFYHDEEQKKEAQRSKKELDDSSRYTKPIVTKIIGAYHQYYYKEHSIKYKLYRFNSGRDQYLKKIWSKEMEKKESKTGYKGFVKPTK